MPFDDQIYDMLMDFDPMEMEDEDNQRIAMQLMDVYNVDQGEFEEILMQVMEELCWYGYVDCEDDMHDDVPFEVFFDIFGELGYDLTEEVYEWLVEFDPQNMDDPDNQRIAGDLMNYYNVDE